MPILAVTTSWMLMIHISLPYLYFIAVNAYRLFLTNTKSIEVWGSASYPAGEAYNAPPGFLVRSVKTLYALASLALHRRTSGSTLASHNVLVL